MSLLKRELEESSSEHELVRKGKLIALKERGIEPYPAATYHVNFYARDLEENYQEGLSVSVAGRLMSRRIQGKASFAELLDSTGKLQVYFNRDEICPGEDKSKYNIVYKKLLDIGDIIGIEGTLFTTRVGVKTVLVESYKLLSKSLRPLPLPKTDSQGKVFDEFTDPEQRYRQRYIDLIVNQNVKETFVKRTKITNLIRDFLNKREYLEVETPILQSIPGGANAKPFETFHNALNIPLYLRIANELYLKRLIVGGFEGVYEFSKDFRNEGMDRNHNPEFTVLEFYVAYKDYLWMMDTTEQLLLFIVQNLFNESHVKLGDKEINFKPPFPRITLTDSIKEHAGIDITGKDQKELFQVVRRKLEIEPTMSEGKIIDTLFSHFCEKHYVQPTFITDYPKSMSPLTKEHRSNPDLTERFELFIDGKEVANAYSELNDPIDQIERFREQLKLTLKGDDEAMFVDHDFVSSLKYGMPPTSGIGIGIDRLVMLLTNNSSIQEVLFFPQMKPIPE